MEFHHELDFKATFGNYLQYPHLRYVFILGDSVSLLINNLGGTSVLELHVVAKDAIQWLGEFDLQYQLILIVYKQNGNFHAIFEIKYETRMFFLEWETLSFSFYFSCQ